MGAIEFTTGRLIIGPVRRLPEFVEGEQFRQLHPTREGGRKWRYRIVRPVRLRIDGLVRCGVISFRDASGREWLRMDELGATLRPDYTWNGCTPKRWVRPVGWVGTPDFKCTHLASAFHDAFYQFHACEHMPLHRSDADRIFRQIIELCGEPVVAQIYHAGVRKFGTWSGRPRNGEHSVMI